MTTKYKAPLIPQLKDYGQIGNMIANSYTNYSEPTVSDILGQSNFSDPSYDFSYTQPIDYTGMVTPTPGAVTPISVNFLQDPLGTAYRQGHLVGDYLNNVKDSTVAQTKQWLNSNIKPTVNSTKLAWNNMDLAQRTGTVTGILKDLTGMYYGHKQIQNAQDTLNFNKQAWQKQWDANSKAYNSHLADRQARRVQSATINGNANTETSVTDYMKKYGV